MLQLETGRPSEAPSDGWREHYVKYQLIPTRTAGKKHFEKADRQTDRQTDRSTDDEGRNSSRTNTSIISVT